MGLNLLPGRLPFFRKFLYHAIGWSVFIFYEVSLVTAILGGKNGQPVLTAYILPYLVHICFFYYNAHVALDAGFRGDKKKPGLFLALALVGIVVHLYLVNLIDQLEGDPKIHFLHLTDPGQKLEFIKELWRTIYFLLFSAAYWFLIQTLRKEARISELRLNHFLEMKQKQELEKNLIESQNAYLQSQINPHLLFNTLNFIYSEVHQASPQASEAVILLTDMMNYSLLESDEDKMVLLDRELQQIETLIKINRIRFNNTLHIAFRVKGEISNMRIIPLALVTLAENVFKHGDLSNPKDPAIIQAEVINNQLFFTIENKKREYSPSAGHGIGMHNVIKRLSTAYKDQFKLEVNENEDYYSLTLWINLSTPAYDNLLRS